VPDLPAFPRILESGRVRLLGERDRRVTVMLGHNQVAATLATQLDELVSWGYETITIDQFADYLDTGDPSPLPLKPLLLTFDDGGLSNYTDAYPALQARGLKATMYLIPNWMDDVPGVFADHLEPNHFTWANAVEMKASGLIDFQSHSMSHLDLTALGGIGVAGGNGSAAGSDFLAAKRRIEQMIPGQVVRHAACPYGSSNAVVEEALRRAGCRTSRIVRNNIGPDGMVSLATIDTDPMRVPCASASMFAGNVQEPNFYGRVDPEGNVVKDPRFLAGGLGWAASCARRPRRSASRPPARRWCPSATWPASSAPCGSRRRPPPAAGNSSSTSTAATPSRSPAPRRGCRASRPAARTPGSGSHGLPPGT
jgi:peptidoglycan/xylan/chitin deacetylase (PgdA/CDA1 family)